VPPMRAAFPVSAPVGVTRFSLGRLPDVRIREPAPPCGPCGFFSSTQLNSSCRIGVTWPVLELRTIVVFGSMIGLRAVPLRTPGRKSALARPEEP
jgi:hypothetical protein